MEYLQIICGNNYNDYVQPHAVRAHTNIFMCLFMQNFRFLRIDEIHKTHYNPFARKARVRVV